MFGIFIDHAGSVTQRRGSIYIADGCRNNRVIVFDAKRATSASRISRTDRASSAFTGGHRCVLVGNDGLVCALRS
jgi:hypothetical protein